MVSIPKQQPTTAGPTAAEMPFASYAQIVRMLTPLARKVSFHNAAGHSLWISDGIEEPELRMHIELLLTRSATAHANRTALEHGSGTEDEPVHVLPIRDAAGRLRGAISIVFSHLPANAAYRQHRTVERLLAPLLEILAHDWRPDPEDAVEPRNSPASQVRSAAQSNMPAAPGASPDSAANSDDKDESESAADIKVAPTPLPALLRRTLAAATEQLGCAFGTIVVPNRPFTLSHRISTDESDLAINAAIDAVRMHVLRWMMVRNEPLIINSTSPGRTEFGTYKILALPLRQGGCGPLAALIVLFRSRHDRDFVSADTDSLMLSALAIPDDSLAELARQPVAALPVLRTVVNPNAPAPPKMTMDMRVRAALRDDTFSLYVQSISPLRKEQRPARFEVLLRMQELKTLHAPSVFFAAAAASSLMPEVDRWVIRNLLRKLRDNAAVVRSGQWEFCINIAAQSLTENRFSEFVIAEVCRSAIPAGLLVFEVSEANAFEHQHALEHLGARLRDVGCRIALDNCREGLGTFGAMNRWTVSCVKIDGSVIRNVLSNSRCASLVRDVARHAAGRGIETVAECVEGANVRDKLLDIGIDYAQGFHYGQPQPITTLFR